MKERERQHDEREGRPADGSPAGGDNLAALSADAQRLLAAADDAIGRVLSADSREFLAANRQRGGE